VPQSAIGCFSDPFPLTAGGDRLSQGRHHDHCRTDAGIAPMTYVTQGKIKMIIPADGKSGQLTINPISDYSVKHNEQIYTVFVQEQESPKSKCFKDTYKFISPPTLMSYLVKAAVAQTCLQITIDDSDNIISIQAPA
jgi:hypothetical protein